MTKFEIRAHVPGEHENRLVETLNQEWFAYAVYYCILENNPGELPAETLVELRHVDDNGSMTLVSETL